MDPRVRASYSPSLAYRGTRVVPVVPGRDGHGCVHTGPEALSGEGSGLAQGDGTPSKDARGGGINPGVCQTVGERWHVEGTKPEGPAGTLRGGEEWKGTEVSVQREAEPPAHCRFRYICLQGKQENEAPRG